MRTTLFLLLSCLLFIPAQAQDRIYCPIPEDGIWVNKSAKAKEITRIEIESKCVDNDVQMRLRAFTKCSPRDCKWGWQKAEFREYGGIRSYLIGFLSTKAVFARAMNGLLDVRLIEIPHDHNEDQKQESYTLTRVDR